MIRNNLTLFWQGGRDTLPLLVAAMPFGFVYGALATEQGGSGLWVLAMSMFVFAGASQFIAITLLASAAALPVVVLTVFIVNLRHSLYAASLMSSARRWPAWLRAPMAFWLTDETFAVVSRRISQAGNDSDSDRDVQTFIVYYLGSAVSMYLNWLLCTGAGILAGQTIVGIQAWGLDVAMVMAFVGIVVPMLRNLPQWLCALVACTSALLTFDWPHQTGLLFSAILAIVIAVFVQIRSRVPQTAFEAEPGRASCE
ncbi:MAG: AzlC family ABC transporter permease [Pseudomonadales bacterium]|nr:AzlC family ABC transporter permease [Pseudomonadales bacterium]